jgi:hypothetical protein
MTTLDRARRGLGDLLAEPADALVLPLSALLLLLHAFETRSPALEAALVVVCAALLLRPALRESPAFWAAACAPVGAHLLWNWTSVPNHGFLIAYWGLACALAAGSGRPAQVLAHNARWLVGLSFLLAVAWKVRNPAYLDGSVTEYFVVTGVVRNLTAAAAWVGGLSPAQVDRNERHESAFLAAPQLGASEALDVTPAIHAIALLVAVWALVIEIGIAVAFLAPRPRSVERWRHPLLLTFIYSSYVFVPIALFADVLAVLGLAQCSPDQRLTRAAYLASGLAAHGARLG